MSSGYWKLWHDASGRFFVGFVLVTIGLVSVFVPTAEHGRPSACVVSGGLAWPEQRAQYVRYAQYAREYRDNNRTPQFAIPEYRFNPVMLADADILVKFCKPGTQPNPGYAVTVQMATDYYVDATWSMMALLFLFVGILISVGPPFSGESMEAFALTFSLPWSREKWLIGKVTMAIALLAVLTLYVLIVSMAASHFPHLHGLKGFSSAAPHVTYPSFTNVAAAFLAGIVGISLGMAASMYARNVLTATVAAGLVAYALVSVNLGLFPGSLNDMSTFALSSFAIICGAALLSTDRLRRTDY